LADVREASVQGVKAEFQWRFPKVVPLEMSRILLQ
jgi:hypothetical protein